MSITLKQGSVYDVLDRSPLNARGWCLQERILSRRIIHFASDQMYWECQKYCLAEDGALIEESNAFKRCLQFSDAQSNLPWSHITRSWSTITQEYSRRGLSHLSDKLPALSGLASLIHSKTGAKYLGGLWKNDLPLALLWNSTAFPERDGWAQRASTWRAPSWS